MDKDGKEYTLKSESLIRVLGIQPYYPPSEPLTKRYEKGLAKKQEYVHEGRRKRKDFFASVMLQYIPQWSQEYFSSAGYPYDKRLFDLLHTCRMRLGTVTITKYSSTGKKKYYTLTEGKIQKLFIDSEISYHADAAHELLEKIKCLQAQCLEAQWQEELDELSLFSEQGANAANWLKANWGRFSFYDGYLVYQPPVYAASAHTARHASVITSLFKQEYDLKPSQCKPIFQTLMYRLKLQEKLLEGPEESYLTLVDNQCCVGVYSNAKNVCGVFVDKDKDKLSLKQATSVPRHSLKTIPFAEFSPLTKSAEELLAAITGRNKDAADQLAKLFADIADPRSGQPRISVVFTKQNKDILQRLLHETFHKVTTSETISINKALSKKGKADLLNQQICGEALVLLNDTLPSDTYLTDFVSAAKGKSLEIEDSILGKQSFKNHLHFVYVTDRPLIVSKLSNQYDAAVIDLSEWEHSYTTDKSVLLSASDRNWFRTAFVLQGCCVKHLTKRNKASKRRPDVATKDIAAFFKARCKVSRKAACERNELYKAYCEYYQDIHGCLPPESSIVFNRYMKQVCPPSVEYKIKRYGESAATHLCYVGLKICPKEESWSSGQQDSKSEFQRYLQDIGQTAKTLFFSP